MLDIETSKSYAPNEKKWEGDLNITTKNNKEIKEK